MVGSGCFNNLGLVWLCSCFVTEGGDSGNPCLCVLPAAEIRPCGQDAFALDASGKPELSFRTVLSGNDHALGVLHLPVDYEAVEVHAGLQFSGLEDEFASVVAQIV